MNTVCKRMAAWLCLALAGHAPLASAQVSPPTRCIVPAKAGGGFDLTCQLARGAWQPGGPELAMAYQPGGIGALVYRELTRPASVPAAERPSAAAGGPALVAWSSGTLLNLAQGRFGRYEPGTVHWVAALALDHGVVAVHRDAPWRDLPALLAALKANPSAVSFATTTSMEPWSESVVLPKSAVELAV